LAVYHSRKKKFLFCGNHEATVSMSFACSLLVICKSHNVAPKDYLNDIITPQYPIIKRHPWGTLESALAQMEVATFGKSIDQTKLGIRQLILTLTYRFQ